MPTGVRVEDYHRGINTLGEVGSGDDDDFSSRVQRERLRSTLNT
jgi:hypothetical protein